MSNPNEPAFPVGQIPGADLADQPHAGGGAGLSKREWLAGRALAGYLAAHAGLDVTMPEFARAAREALGYADALLAALNPETKESR